MTIVVGFHCLLVFFAVGFAGFFEHEERVVDMFREFSAELSMLGWSDSEESIQNRGSQHFSLIWQNFIRALLAEILTKF